MRCEYKVIGCCTPNGVGLSEFKASLASFVAAAMGLFSRISSWSRWTWMSPSCSPSLAGVSGFSVIRPSGRQSATGCVNGNPIGRNAFKFQLNNLWVRVGIGSGFYVGSKSIQLRAWGTFEIDDFGKRDGLN